MALITDKPEELQPQNDLDDIEDPDDVNEYGLSIDRYLAFGTTPKAIPNPPRDGEVVTYQVKVECVGQAHKRRTDGEMRYRSELTILSVARSGDDLPPDFSADKKKTKKQQDAELAKAAADNQEPLFPDTDEDQEGDDNA